MKCVCMCVEVPIKVGFWAWVLARVIMSVWSKCKQFGVTRKHIKL